jgi:hypothetical protein
MDGAPKMVQLHAFKNLDRLVCGKNQPDDAPARLNQLQFMIETDSLLYWRAEETAWLHEDLFIIEELNWHLHIRLTRMQDGKPTLS